MDGREFDIPTAEGLFLLRDVSADTRAAQRPAADAARIPGSRGGRMIGAAGAVLRVRCASQYSRPRLILELLDGPPTDADADETPLDRPPGEPNTNETPLDRPPAESNTNNPLLHGSPGESNANETPLDGSPAESKANETLLDGSPGESNADGSWHWEVRTVLDFPTGRILIEGDTDEGALPEIPLPGGPGRYGVALGHAGRAEHQRRIAGAGNEDWPEIQRLERYKIRVWFIGV
ncbi:hypothetical protein [Dactylosporangium sp. CS-033363]|uniref:hypothetical protein n=1 Tax=Dactylosporangium sp. CS-033363 TaxID=3239935 RepID=UPI003D8F21F4